MVGQWRIVGDTREALYARAAERLGERAPAPGRMERPPEATTPRASRQEARAARPVLRFASRRGAAAGR